MKNYGAQQQNYVPTPVILPQGYNNVATFTPRTITVSQSQPSYTTAIVPQQVGSAIIGVPVIVQNRAPIARWVLNPYTGRLELAYY